MKRYARQVRGLKCLITVILLVSPAWVFAEWRAEFDINPVTKQPQCLLKTEVKKLYDGKDNAKVYLMLNNKDLFVVTDSNIDQSFSEIGIKVDKNKFLPLTNVMSDKNVVFEGYIHDHVGELKKGNSATVGLGFWPTWPKSKLRKIKFSLSGFSQAHGEFTDCLELQRNN